MKIKNLNCEETQKNLIFYEFEKLKLWWNSKIVMKLEHSNCDKTQKLKLGWNSKTQKLTKLF